MNMSKRAATGGYDPSGIDLDAWTELEEQLEATIPNYDRVNRLMTFGQDKRWRRNVRNHASKGMKVLEVGCGPGSFAEDLVGLDVTCLDPSEAMLKVAKKRVDGARALEGHGRRSVAYRVGEFVCRACQSRRAGRYSRAWLAGNSFARGYRPWT